MLKAKFAAARELIREKRYDAAREILLTIDHPTAREWLDKLAIKERVPPKKGASTKNDKDVQKKGVGCGLSIIALVFVCALVLLIDSEAQPNTPTTQLGLAEQIASRELRDANATVLVTTSNVTITWRIRENLTTGMTRQGALNNIVDASCDLREAGFDKEIYQFNGYLELIDVFGNTSIDRVIGIRLNPATVGRINCRDKLMVNLNFIADDYFLHPALS